ncbi:SIR2 family protein [Aeromonas veronii]|uniref:SIR2 family protein n=1 Tax=Aeromonas veronii TaxID=654 RepID=UPI003B9F82CF
MEVLSLDSSKAKELLKIVFATKRCVPFIGAGFSAGEASLKGRVPSVTEFNQIMIRELSLLEKYEGKTDWLSKQDFFKVSDYFWRDCPQDRIDSIIRDRFTKVRLSKVKKDFLKINWHNITTLNIDDGIENSVAGYHKVLPHTKLKSHAFNSNKLLIKIHGDANTEINNKTQESQIIFSRNSYLDSQLTNKDVLNLFKTNWKENNLLFIGCSLIEEIDLVYMLSTSSEAPYKDTFRIFFTNQEKANDSDFKTALEMDYKITHFIVAEKWDDIYVECLKHIEKDNNKIHSELSKFHFNTFHPLANEFQKTIDHILQTDNLLSSKIPFEKYIPQYLVERDALTDILHSIQKNPFTLIEGRRFSGQTSLLKLISQRLQPANVFFFNSGVKITPIIINQILDADSSYFLFDGRCLNIENILLLIHKSKNIITKNNRVVIVSSTTDGGLGTPLIDKFGDEISFRIKQELTTSEYRVLDKKLDYVGISKFKRREPLLNSIYVLAKQYPEFNSNIFPSLVTDNDEYLLLLLLLFTNEKVTSGQANLINIKSQTLSAFVDEFSPLVLLEENIDTATIDGRHEVYLNCKPWCASIFNSFEEHNGTQECSDLVNLLIERLKNSYFGERVFIKLIRVDNLSILFPKKYKNFIDNLFYGLKDYLNEMPDFWLQWSKALLYTSNNIERLLSGARYVTKALNDGSETTRRNATHTRALIYGKIAELRHFKDTEYNCNAIKHFFEAIAIRDENTRYVKELTLKTNKANKQIRRLINTISVDPRPEYLPLTDEVRTLKKFIDDIYN